MLARSPRDRFQTAANLVAALEQTGLAGSLDLPAPSDPTDPQDGIDTPTRVDHPASGPGGNRVVPLLITASVLLLGLLGVIVSAVEPPPLPCPCETAVKERRPLPAGCEPAGDAQ
jgi:hypothetical protein